MSTRPRFWCPPTGRIALDAGGFLAEPGGLFAGEQSLEIYDEIDRHRCLVLLGEPGIGKTTELARAIAAADAHAHHVDLGAVADAEGLRRLVIEAPAIAAWRDGDDELVLFLDAFDEALAERGVLGRALIAELAALPVDRLRMRIACRTADWPATMTDRLVEVFGEAHEYELQPLTRADAVAAAAAAGVDGQAFANEATDRGVGPLARVPLTLHLLLGRFVRDGALPTTRVELYRDGCRELCREQNPSRLETGRTGTLSAEERLAIAERIAAATALGGRAAVRLRGAGSEATVAELAELAGGSERTSADLVAVATDVGVDEQRLRETLATGLFTSRGDDIVGFAHHSYGEFLAARFLSRHRFDRRRALNLLAQERAGRQRVVPQLAGVAAWLADLDGLFLDWLISNEPEIALRADVEAMHDARKRSLVEALLTRADTLTEFTYPTLGKLAHPGLAEQLRPWLPAGRVEPARRLAIEIAGAAAAAGLYELLVERVLDEDEEIRIRIDAGWALWRAAPPELRARLKPLALAAPETDLDDDLKGVALLCVWPESLTVDELLAALSPPKRDNYLGAYGLFLSQELIARLTDSNLIRMLEWARELGTVGHHRRFAELIDDILAAAWQRLDAADVAAAFAATTAALLAREHRFGAGSYRAQDLEELVRGDGERRRLVTELLVPALRDGTLEPYHFITAAPFVQADELHWLLERALAATDEAEKRAWARLVDLTFRGPPSFADADAVLAACAADPVIANTVENVYGAIAVDSAAAAAGRERLARQREFAEQREERERRRAEHDAASPARLRAALERFERGDLDAYLALDAELLHKPGAGGIDHATGDVRALPNWERADDELRARLVAAARRYLAEGPIDGHQWSARSLAAYRALRLLRAEGVPIDVSAERLGALVPTMLGHPLSGADDRAAAGELLAEVAAAAPDEFIRGVLTIAEREAAQHGVVFFLGRLDGVPVGAVDDALCELVAERRLAQPALASVLEALLERGAPCAAALALELVERRDGGGDDAALPVSAAALLLVHTSERDSAAAVIAAMQADPPFGRAVVERLADRGPVRRNIPALPADLTAELFLFAAAEFGWDEEGWAGHHIGSWRSSLLARLRDAGTNAAQAQLERLQQELPELRWLARISEEGEARTLAATWEPPEPRTVIALAAVRSQRYVVSGDQLVEAVVDALDAIQHELDTEASWANDLFHRRDGGVEPVSEPEASTWLARRLREKLTGERGIVFQREVQITQPPGPGLGDRTDVHVTAVIQHRDAAAEELTTIVEVKGCWNADVDTALETQLVDRYLRATANPYGVYLVIWFASKRWRDKDRRRAVCARRDREQTMQAVAERARELEGEQSLYLRVVALTVRLR